MTDIKLCAIDSEGDTGEHGLLSISWWSDRDRGYATDWQAARRTLLQHAKDGYTLVAHNAEYDIGTIFWQNREHVRCVYYNSKFNHGEWFYDYVSNPCHIWDSVGLSGGLSLARLGDSLGIPKYETPQSLLNGDVNKYRWKCDAHDKWECVECYSLRDVEIVYTYMQYYLDVCSMYAIDAKRTLGSAAVAIWRKVSDTKPIWIQDKIKLDMARASYHGGRVECFKLGKIRNVWTADVISMYPYIMRNVEMPMPKSLFYNDSNKLDEHWIEKEGCSEVTIYVPPTYIPVLPVLHDDRVYYPVGRLRGIWINAEIRAAVGRGARIEKVHRVLYATQTMPMFKTYVDELMRLRDDFKRKGDARQQTVKILLNSLYGRIGLQGTQVEEHIEPMPEGASSTHFPDREWRIVNGRVFMRKEIKRTQNPRYGNVLWAATITAYARLRLLEFMEEQGSGLLYCDTDSIFSSSPIHASGDKLGDLSQVEEWEHARIIAPKLYSLNSYSGEEKVRAKGVPARVAHAYITTGEATYSQPYRAREMLSSGGNTATWRDVTKRMRTNIAKRTPLDIDDAMRGDRFSDTEPIVMHEHLEDSDDNYY